MDLKMKERLIQGGINVDELLERLLGHEAMLERLFKRFLQDSSFQTLCQAVETGAAEEALAASHTLKGMCGNLSMVDLTSQFTQQVALLRAGDWEGAVKIMPQLRQDYERVCNAIRGCWL